MWRQEEIKNLILREPRLAMSALLAVYDFQNKNERQIGLSRVKDGLGFSKFDAPHLNAACEYIRKYKQLPKKDETYLIQKAASYARQLTLLANNMFMGKETPNQLNFISDLESANMLLTSRV